MLASILVGIGIRGFMTKRVRTLLEVVDKLVVGGWIDDLWPKPRTDLLFYLPKKMVDMCVLTVIEAFL